MRPEPTPPTASRAAVEPRAWWVPRWLWGTAGGALALFLALVLVGWILRPPAQPGYEGRTVSEWAAVLGSTDAPTREQARRALHALGTKAVPVLARAVARPDPMGLGWYMRNRGLLPVRLARQVNRILQPEARGLGRVRAAVALRELGPLAEGATPALALVLKRPSATLDGQAAKLQAAYALAGIGPAGVPILLDAIEHAPWDQRGLLFAALASSGTNAVSAATRLAALVVRDPQPDLPQQVGILMRGAGAPGGKPFLDGLATADATGRLRLAEVLVGWAGQDRTVLAALTERFAGLPTPGRQALMQGFENVPADQPRLSLFMAQTLSDPDPEVRDTAGAWLTRQTTLSRLEPLVARHLPVMLDEVRRVFREETPRPVDR